MSNRSWFKEHIRLLIGLFILLAIATGWAYRLGALDQLELYSVHRASPEEMDAAYQVYQRFALAFLHNDLESARQLAHGEAQIMLARAEEVRSGEQRLPVQETNFMEVARNARQDGTVTFHVVLVVQWRTPEFMPPEFHRQQVVLVHTHGRWLVTFFKDDHEPCCQ